MHCEYQEWKTATLLDALVGWACLGETNDTLHAGVPGRDIQIPGTVIRLYFRTSLKSDSFIVQGRHVAGSSPAQTQSMEKTRNRLLSPE